MNSSRISGTSSASSGSEHPCHNCAGRFTGRYYDTCLDNGMLRDICKEQTEASRAPLCSLPPYMASRYGKVRRAAKARFIELQEGVVA